jgi:hypothetical protein
VVFVNAHDVINGTIEGRRSYSRLTGRRRRESKRVRENSSVGKKMIHLGKMGRIEGESKQAEWAKGVWDGGELW